MSREEIDQFLVETDANGEFRTLRNGDRSIAWIEAGNTTGPLVVFVHGSPGSLSAWTGFFEDQELLERARLISLDRPGFGYSDLGRAELTLARQAGLVAAVVDAIPGERRAILIGHSYAGPVIARVAIDRPELVDGLILVAASVDPDLEPKYWFQRPFASPALRWLVPRPLRASNEEIIALEPELRAMQELWPEVRTQVTIIQGGKDELVPPDNRLFAERVLVNADITMVYVEEMVHFVPWSDPNLIRDAILEQLDRGRSLHDNGESP